MRAGLAIEKGPGRGERKRGRAVGQAGAEGNVSCYIQ